MVSHAAPNKVLPDSDALSEIVKRRNPIVAAHAQAYRSVRSLFSFSAVTLVEVIRGCDRKGDPKQLQPFLAMAATEEVINLDRQTAGLPGRITGELERIGRPIGLADPMIAATAIVHGLDLATDNTAHFRRSGRLGIP